MAVRLFLIRHGESEENAQRKFSGFSDVDLTKKGIWQAERLAKRLKYVHVDLIYCSDLKRAIRTADIIFGDRGIKLIKKPNLREVNFGEWESKTIEEVRLKQKEKFNSWFINPDEKSCPPQGESLADFDRRVMSEVGLILQKNHHGEEKDKTIAIVCHGGTIRIVLCSVLNLALKNIWNMRQESTALNIIDYNDSKSLVSLLNDTSHLEEWWKK